VYVNLYIPSSVRWTENASALSLTQEGEYPYKDHVTFTVTASLPMAMTPHFRIPAWADGASVALNGARIVPAQPGTFAAIGREWKAGDRVELELPLNTRLEPVDTMHADIVALVRGPLVLMAMKQQQEGPVPEVTRKELLAPLA
jgi:DUF1680 family protein